MSVTRSCYRTTMRFPGVGLVPVRWFFTDRDFLPFPHVYDNLMWDRQDIADQDGDTGEPGEVWNAPRPWRNGEGPDLTGCDSPFGSPAAWLGLTDASSPTTPCGGTFGGAYALDYSDSWDSLTFAEE